MTEENYVVPGITKCTLYAENEEDVKELDRICKVYDEMQNPTQYYIRIGRKCLETTQYTD